jgi:hypothetical protein
MPSPNPIGGVMVVQSLTKIFLANLQALRRGDVVIVIDPKNSRRLRRVTQRACEDWRGGSVFDRRGQARFAWRVYPADLVPQWVTAGFGLQHQVNARDAGSFLARYRPPDVNDRIRHLRAAMGSRHTGEAV